MSKCLITSTSVRNCMIQPSFRCCLFLLQIFSITDGAQEVKEKATSQEKNDGQPGHSVHLPVLQPREILRCQNVSSSGRFSNGKIRIHDMNNTTEVLTFFFQGTNSKYRNNIVQRLLGGVPDPDNLYPFYPLNASYVHLPGRFIFWSYLLVFQVVEY